MQTCTWLCAHMVMCPHGYVQAYATCRGYARVQTYVCMCGYVHTCIRVRGYVQTCTHTRAWLCTKHGLCAGLRYVSANVCMCRGYVPTWLCPWLCPYVCMAMPHVWLCVSTCTCAHTVMVMCGYVHGHGYVPCVCAVMSVMPGLTRAWLCTYTCSKPWLCPRGYVHVCKHIYVCVWLCPCVLMSMCGYVCTCAHTGIVMSMCVLMSMCVCAYVCTCAYTGYVMLCYVMLCYVCYVHIPPP